MVIDTSAIVAAIAGEPDHARYRDAIKSADLRLLSAVTLLETQIVLFARLGPDAITVFNELIDRSEIGGALRRGSHGGGVPGVSDLWQRPRTSGTLNIIDCVAYALARARGLPLLFKGLDFGRTDITPALVTG